LVSVLSLALALGILALPLRADETQSGRLTSAQAVLEGYEEALYTEYKSFGARLMPTMAITRTDTQSQTFRLLSVTCDPLPDSLFALPAAVRALMK
jgi:hypothetical protein